MLVMELNLARGILVRLVHIQCMPHLVDLLHLCRGVPRPAPRDSYEYLRNIVAKQTRCAATNAFIDRLAMQPSLQPSGEDHPTVLGPFQMSP